MMIKNIIFALCIFTSFQLFSMEIEPQKKSNDDYGLTKHYCLVREMQGYGDTGNIGIPKDVANTIILQTISTPIVIAANIMNWTPGGIVFSAVLSC